MMAVERTRWTKNPKTRRIRELLDQEKRRIKLVWIPSRSGVTGSEKADEAAKNALEEDFNDRELYLPQYLIKWTKKTDTKNRQKRWAQGEKTMRLRKETIEWKEHTIWKWRSETGTTREVKTDGTEGLKRLLEYTKKIGLFHGYEQKLRVEDQELITRNYKEKNTNGQECKLKRKKKGKEEKKNEMLIIKEKKNVKIKIKMWLCSPVTKKGQ
jgi:hypothetical protein